MAPPLRHYLSEDSPGCVKRSFHSALVGTLNFSQLYVSSGYCLACCFLLFVSPASENIPFPRLMHTSVLIQKLEGSLCRPPELYLSVPIPTLHTYLYISILFFPKLESVSSVHLFLLPLSVLWTELSRLSGEAV